MKTKVALSYVIVALAVAGLAGCGSSGSGAAAATGGDTTATGADVSSLTTLPTSDLSAYDTTESAASANLSVLGKSLTAKEIPGARGAGKLCRACCEANMQKKQIFRSSVMAQQMRCVAEAFQKAGLITAGTNDYNIYSITPPSDSSDDKTKKCKDIPDERTEERTACESGDEGPKSGVLMRLGVFGGNELRVDICKSKPTLVHQNEGTYSLSNGVVSTNVVHIGTFGSHSEKMSLSSTVTGMTGLDSDLVPTLNSSTGAADATARIDSDFGSGTITFKRTEADKSITISGAFDGKVHEYNSDTDTTFVGKAYAQGGGTSNTVAAKFSFTGAPPPMKLSKIIPFDIPRAQLAAFLAVMSNQFGFEVTTTNYTSLFVCPNPLFDPAAPSLAIKPMVLADATTHACPTATHTGIECGTITNGTEDSGFTGMRKKTTQTFTTLDCNDTTVKTFYTAVSAFDLSTLTANITPIAFTRDWDCSGTATALDFSALTRAQGETLQAYMLKCDSLEERGRGNGGISEYDCSSRDGANAINDVKKAPPAEDNQGPIAGSYSIGSGNCTTGAVPSKLFINTIDKTANSYCFPDNKGGCATFGFAVNPPSASGLPIDFKKGDGTIVSISGLSFVGPPITTMDVTWSTPSCTQRYTKDTAVSFTAPTEPADGKSDDFPTECVARGLTTPQACGDYCQSHSCTPPH